MDTTQQEEILLNEIAEAANYDFFMVSGLEVSPDHKRLAYAEDTSGGEKYTLHVKDLETGKELLKEPIKVTGHMLCINLAAHILPSREHG